MGQPSTSNNTLSVVSTVVTAAANVVGIITLLNLGKSFGILIALRKVKRHGAYGLIRHPMYFSDILLRCGYLVSHFNVFVVIMFIVSTACYVYRALLEERHLSERKEYREYMTRVRYRFIPFVF
jgi:protein-S-isoprenylcysteine O-methyltransferase Ste14